MASLNIFVSFEFDKDYELKESFYAQATKHSPHKILNCSLNESYPNETWKRKARATIKECDVVIVLIGPDTHNAQGVIVEMDMARSFCKHVIQIRPQGSPYKGLARLGKPIAWKWKSINTKLNEILAKRH